MDIGDNCSTNSIYVWKDLLYFLVPIIVVGNGRIMSKYLQGRWLL